MLNTLIQRELLNNLMTFRFTAVFLITLLLVVANTFVLIQDYEQRVENYHDAVEKHDSETKAAKTYSSTFLFVDRPPNPLSIFNVGLDKRLGNVVSINHGFIPTLWDSYMHGTDNPFIAFFSSIDIVYIFEVILSLMGLIFAYDSIAGEREGGTLRLVLAHPIRRGYIIIAKYISTMVCLFIPLLLSLLLSLILLIGSIPFSTDDYLRICGIVFTSMVYLSLFYLIGMLISIVSRRTGTALMLAMFVWGFLILVYPNLIRATLNQGAELESLTKTATAVIQQEFDEFERKRHQFLVNEGISEDTSDFNRIFTLYSDVITDPTTLEAYIENSSKILRTTTDFDKHLHTARRYFDFVERLTIRTIEKTWLIRNQAIDDIFVRQATMDNILLRLSPVGIYDTTTQAWAGTDLHGVRSFFDTTRHYRNIVIDYFYAKDVFGSPEWFIEDKSNIDWGTFPKFIYERGDIGTNLERSLPGLVLLTVANLLVFILILLVFFRSDV